MSTMRNSVMMIGRPTKPVMNSEENKASFKLAVTESYKSGGCCAPRTFTFDCVANGETAKQVVKKVEEGRLLAIDGSLRCYDYQDRVGDTHTHTEIKVFEIFLIETAKEG